MTCVNIVVRHSQRVPTHGLLGKRLIFRFTSEIETLAALRIMVSHPTLSSSLDCMVCAQSPWQFPFSLFFPRPYAAVPAA
jgi:hypothetical protein